MPGLVIRQQVWLPRLKTALSDWSARPTRKAEREPKHCRWQSSLRDATLGRESGVSGSPRVVRAKAIGATSTQSREQTMANQRCEPAGVTLEDGTARNRPAREGLRQGRAGEDNDRRPPSEGVTGSRGSEPGASRRGWSLKALAGGVFRLGVPYDGCEPEEMAVEGYQVRGHPAREESKTGLTDKTIGQSRNRPHWSFGRRGDC